MYLEKDTYVSNIKDGRRYPTPEITIVCVSGAGRNTSLQRFRIKGLPDKRLKSAKGPLPSIRYFIMNDDNDGVVKCQKNSTTPPRCHSDQVDPLVDTGPGFRAMVQIGPKMAQNWKRKNSAIF